MFVGLHHTQGCIGRLLLHKKYISANDLSQHKMENQIGNPNVKFHPCTF